jgi:hypothetical protein
VSFFKGTPGDEVYVIANAKSTDGYAAVETIIKASQDIAHLKQVENLAEDAKPVEKKPKTEKSDAPQKDATPESE